MSVSASARSTGVATDTENRERDDFYPTPPYAVEALLAREQFTGPIWEPACGDGAISDVLKAHGHHVQSTDLVDRGYGTPRVDFLMEFKTQAPNIITNPPYVIATEFAYRALDLATAKVAFLCKVLWLEGQDRRKLFDLHPPRRIWVFSARLPMWRGRQATEDDNGGTIAFAWYVWEVGYQGKPELGWI